MIVYHFGDDNCSHQVDSNAPVRAARNWVVVRSKYQPVLAVNINGVLLIAIAGQLVPSEWRRSRNFR